MKHFVFVGGSRGIARSAVETLLKSDLESIIHVFSREAPQFDGIGLAPEQVDRVVWKSFDASSPEGSIDLADVDFENFAGYVYAPGSINLRPFTSLSLEDFQFDFEINLLANVRVLKQIMPSAKKSLLQPSFVFFSTVAALKGMPMHSSISAAKSAVEGFTRSMAAEYAPKMRFNCVAPSLTETDLALPLTSRENIRKTSEEKHPLKRLGRPEDVANAVVYLLSDESSWMSGQILRPDGGMSM